MKQQPTVVRVDDIPESRGRLAAIWATISATMAPTLGLLPHLLHHVGLVAGGALVTGATGNILFLGLGVLLSVPMLRRLYRRFHTWVAPAIAVAVFAGMFLLSALVIGPALTDAPPSTKTPADHSPRPTGTQGDHHGG